MAAATVYLKGKVNWAKVRQPDPKYGNYTVDLYPDNDSVDIWVKSEAQTAFKTNADTQEKYLVLRRPDVKLVGKELVKYGPPEVLNADGSALDAETLIGNGSEVTCKLTVYDTAKGKGTRLEAVRVDTLVPYAKREVLGLKDGDLAF